MASGAERTDLVPARDNSPVVAGERALVAPQSRTFAEILTAVEPGSSAETPINSIRGGRQFATIVKVPQPEKPKGDASEAMNVRAEGAETRRAKLTEAYDRKRDVVVSITRRPGSNNIEWSVVVPSILAEQQRNLQPLPEDDPEDGAKKMAALYERLGMGDGKNRQLVEEQAKTAWQTAEDPADRILIAHALMGRPTDRDDANYIDSEMPGYMTLLQEGGEFEELTGSVAQLQENKEQIREAMRMHRAQEQEKAAKMRDRYERLGMGDGSDNEFVAQVCADRWEEATSDDERIEIAHAYLGREIDGRDVKEMGEAAAEFSQLLTDGGSFDAFTQTITEIRERREENQAPQEVLSEQVDGTQPPKAKRIVLDDGSIAELIETEEVEERLKAFGAWKLLEVAPVLNPKADIEGADNSNGLAESGFKIERLLTSTEPFALLLHIHPQDPTEIAANQHLINTDLFREGHVDSPDADQKKKSLSALLGSLKAGELSGRFDVDVYVGGVGEEGATEMAFQIMNGVNSSARDLSSRTKVVDITYDSLEDARAAAIKKRKHPRTDGTSGWVDPRHGVSLQQADLFMPTLSGSEAGGISMYELVDWAVNIPKAHEIAEENRISLGVITDKYGHEIGELVADINSLFEHFGVFGTTGKGKSTLLARIAEQVRLKGRPVILLDPKGGLAQIVGDMLKPHGIDVAELPLGELDEALVGINPLDWGENDLPSYIDNLIATIVNAYDKGADKQAAETTTRFLQKALKGTDVQIDADGNKIKKRFKGLYERMGWDPETGKPIEPGTTPMKPNMLHLINVLQEAGDEQQYVMEASNVIKWLVQRQETQGTGKAGQIYNGPPLDFNKLFDVANGSGVTVVRTDKLTPAQYALIGALFMDRFADEVKHRYEESEKPNGKPWKGAYMLVDEINEILQEGTPFAESMASKARLSRGRRGGYGYSGQSPQDTPSAILDNINTWLLMKVHTEQSMRTVQMPMGLQDDQIRNVTRFNNRELAAFFPDMGMEHGSVHGFATYFVGDGSAQILPPEYLVVDSAPENFVTLGNVPELNRRIFESEEGRMLRAITEANIWVRAMGLDKRLGRGELYLQGYLQEGGTGPNPIDALREIYEDSPEALDYMITKTVDRSVYAHSALFLSTTSHLTQESRENFMGQITEAIQTAHLAPEQQGVLMDLIGQTLRTTTRPADGEQLNSNKKFLRKLTGNIMEAMGTHEGEAYSALVSQVLEAAKHTDFEYITFDMLQERLRKDVLAMIKGDPTDDSPDQEFMVDETYGSFAARAILIEYIAAHTPQSESLVEREGTQITDQDIKDFAMIHNFIVEHRERLNAGNQGLLEIVGVYLKKQELIAADQRLFKQKGRHLSDPEKSRELNTIQVTTDDIKHFIKEQKNVVLNLADESIPPQVVHYLLQMRINAAKLRYQRFVGEDEDPRLQDLRNDPRYKGKEALLNIKVAEAKKGIKDELTSLYERVSEVYGADIPGETAWEKFKWLSKQGKTGKVFLAEKFYGVGHMMDSTAGTSLKEAIEGNEVQAWKDSFSNFLNSIGCSSGTLDLIYGEVEKYIQAELAEQTKKNATQAAAQAAAAGSAAAEATRGLFTAPAEQPSAPEHPLSIGEALDVREAFGILGRIQEISDIANPTETDIQEWLSILGETNTILSRVGLSRTEIEDDLTAEIREGILSQVNDSRRKYEPARDGLRNQLANIESDSPLFIGMAARAAYEKLKTKVEILGSGVGRRREAQQRLSLMQDTVELYDMVKDVLADPSKREEFLKAFEYMGPRMIFVYQIISEHGLGEDATEQDKTKRKLQAITILERDLAKFASEDARTQAKRAEGQEGEDKISKMEGVHASDPYKELLRQRDAIWTTQGLTTVQKFQKFMELSRNEFDMFALALSSPEHISVDDTSLNDRLKDFLADPRLRQARFTALMDRLNFETIYLEVNKLTNEDLDSISEGSLRNQISNLSISKTRMLGDPDIQARLAYYETLTATAGELIDDFERSLLDDAIFSDKTAAIRARLDAIDKIQRVLKRVLTDLVNNELD